MMIKENTESDMRGSPPSRWSAGMLVLKLILVLTVWSSVTLTFSFAGHVNRFINIINIGSGNILLVIIFF
jgi:hypothetical protein